MLIEVWDRSTLADQEQTIGRTKVVGAPLGKSHEFDEVQLDTLPRDAHVGLAHRGAPILRRGYSFTDGMDTRLGQLDAGLFFISFQRNPSQFVELQNRLAQNEYISHTGSAIFACPPGAERNSYVGAGLF